MNHRDHSQKTRPVDDVPFVRKWRNQHWFCAACGRAGDITVHHILGGRCGRSDEACNLLALCWEPCHMLAEGLDVPDPEWVREEYVASCVDDLISPELRHLWRNRRLLPKITLAVALAMKVRLLSLEEWMPLQIRLEQLHGRPLPDIAAIPEWFETQFKRNRPELQTEGKA